jgi:ABC-2 type transport system permease protein
MWSLYVESLRAVWGFGRPMTAKAAPFIILGLYSFLALVQLAFSSFFGEAIQRGDRVELFTYSNYFATLSPFIVLFCVAQGPEMVCRDQRYSVLPLYLTRALTAVDYIIAKIAAFTTALFVVLMVPMISLFVGDILMKTDAIKAFGDELPMALPAIPACLLIAAGLATISLALSSFSPRRAYSAMGLVAYFLIFESVLSAVFRLGHHAGWDWSERVKLIGPTSNLSGANEWFFGNRLDPGSWSTVLGSDAYLWAALLSIVIFTAILLLRYRGIRS